MNSTRLISAPLAQLAAMAAVGIGLISAGCSSLLPEAQPDPTRFYVLSSPTANGAPASAVPDAPALRLRPIEIASYLRSRPVIVRRGQNELEFREYARWGEPLEQGIARVLREELLARGVASAVAMSGTRAEDVGPVRYQLSVRVLACEGVANGSVSFSALWELVPATGGSGDAIRGEYRSTDLQWTPKDESTLAAAVSRAVAGLAGEIGSRMKN